MMAYKKIARLGWNFVVGNEERAVLLCFSKTDGGNVAVGTDALMGMSGLKQTEKLVLLCCPSWEMLVPVDALETSDAVTVKGRDGNPDYLLVERWEVRGHRQEIDDDLWAIIEDRTGKKPAQVRSASITEDIPF